MDQPATTPQKIRRLIEEAAVSRDFLSLEIVELKRKLDVPARMRESLREHPTSWVAGSAISGLFASLLFRRPRKPKPKQAAKAAKTGVMGVLLASAVAVAKPIAGRWLANRAKNYWLAGDLPLDHRTTTSVAVPHRKVKSLSSSHV
ncbi:MAG: hypothetical protein V4733_07325 [Verrucomicrobiota bacterium]